MARVVLVDPTVDWFALGTSIENILRGKGVPMNMEEIQQALKEPIGGEYIEATVDEIQEILDAWLVPDDDVTQLEENLFQIKAPCPCLV